MTVRYVSEDTTPLYERETGNKKRLELLWGDHVTIDGKLSGNASGRVKVKARGKDGYVNAAALGKESLLEIYFIDVGQGDGILIRTPDDRHIMIDGGYTRSKQPTGKNAADFVDWKFFKDYGLDHIHLDAMLASHNDADHYGGLWDLLNVNATDELDAKNVTVDAFYHAGVAWWINSKNGERWLGEVTPDNDYMIQLMGNRSAVLAALKDNADPRLQGEWALFMSAVAHTRTKAGKNTPIARLSHVNGYVPGFSGTGGDISIKVLAPVEFKVNGRPTLHNYSSTASKNTNGNSLLLRLDYKRSRILLTGDLNASSQRALLEDYAGERIEFESDVTKACHHGSDEVSYEFLSAIRPAATVISSGDCEGHDHPRPGIVAASATTGYLQIAKDAIVTPLIYSTELARSITLGKPNKLTMTDSVTGQSIETEALGTIKVEAKVVKAGDLNPTTIKKTLGNSYMVTGLIYGLVNVRTDGEKILCATMNEKDNSWQIKTFTSRF